MSFKYNRANSRDLGNMNVLIYMRVHVILHVRDTDQVKLTVCMDTYTNVCLFLRLEMRVYLLIILFLEVCYCFGITC